GSYIMLVHLRPLCGSRGAVGRVAGRPPGNAEDLNLHSVSAVMAKGKHPVPFRTRKLSSSAPMVLRGGPRGRVGRRRTSFVGAASFPGAAPTHSVRSGIPYCPRDTVARRNRRSAG